MAEALPFISMGMQLIGGIVQGIGAKNQADASANAAQYNAAVARNAAVFAQQQGEVRAQASDRQTAAAVGRARAMAAAGGLDVNSGSPLDVQASNASIGRLNSMTIRNNAAREAWGYQANANLDDASAANYRQAGDTAMLGSLIGAGSSVGNTWSQYSQNGVDPFAVFAFG